MTLEIVTESGSHPIYIRTYAVLLMLECCEICGRRYLKYNILTVLSVTVL